MVKYYKSFDKEFEWKFQARGFVLNLKAKARKGKLKLVVKILPMTKFISSIKHQESRTVGYVVRWHYKP